MVGRSLRARDMSRVEAPISQRHRLISAQGCCNSREAAAPAHHDGAEDGPVAQLDASSRNLNAPSSRQPSLPSSRGSFLGRRPPPGGPSNSGAQPTSSTRPNQPLTPIPAEQRSTLPNTLASPTTAKSRHRIQPLTDPSNQAWTRARLEQERRDWWDTRVTGDTQVWRCLQAATEALQGGDVATAQSLLDATGCTCPTGQLWNRTYDDRGNEYRVPEWLVIEPTGIVDDESEEATQTVEDKTDEIMASDTVESDTEFVVRVRLSESSHDSRITVRRRETIALIREKLKAQAQVCITHVAPPTIVFDD